MRASERKEKNLKLAAWEEKKMIFVYVNELVQDQQNKYSDRALVNGELRKELEEVKFPDLPVAGVSHIKIISTRRQPRNF